MLAVHHTPSPAVRLILEACLRGARQPELASVSVVAEPALSATASDVLEADGYLLVTPANIGYMSGAMKHFFDGIYYPCLDAGHGRPYALVVHGNDDTAGAIRSVERIVSALGWRSVAPPLSVIGSSEPGGRSGSSGPGRHSGGNNRRAPAMTEPTPGTQQLSTRQVYAMPWLRVREDEVQFADGSRGIYSVVEKPDFVVVLPYERDGFWLVEQYRYPIGARHWEFPQGGWSQGRSGSVGSRRGRARGGDRAQRRQHGARGVGYATTGSARRRSTSSWNRPDPRHPGP